MKIVKSLKEPALLMKGVNKTIKNKAKEQKVGFLDMLLYLLGVFLLRNLLAGERVKDKIPGLGVVRAGERAITTSQGRDTLRTDQYF